MKNILLLVTALVVLSLLFLWLRPAPAPAPQTAVATAAPAAKNFALVVRDKKLVSGDALLKVTQGDEVVLRVTTDHADELHLHGYDLSLQLQANVTGELKFSADRSGRFEFELHHAHLDLGVLEVAPK